MFILNFISPKPGLKKQSSMVAALLGKLKCSNFPGKKEEEKERNGRKGKEGKEMKEWKRRERHEGREGKKGKERRERKVTEWGGF